MRDYKIALISFEFPPYVIGGIASNCYDLALSLSKKKICTTVFCARTKTVNKWKINNYLNVISLPFINIPAKNIFFQIQNFKKLIELLKNYTIIHTVNPLLSFIGSYLKRKLNKPYITSIHEFILNNVKAFINSPLSDWTIGDFSSTILSYPFLEYLIRNSIMNADHIIVHGSSTFNDIKKKYNMLDVNKMSMIYNGINFDNFQKRTDSNFISENPSIIFYGRLIEIKGILYLIKAINVLKKDFPDINLYIFGKGPLEKKIKYLISNLKLSDRVHLKGFVPNEILLKYIKKSEIVVLPSLYEVGPSISALEAMACKKPLIVFDYIFRREFIIDNYNGILSKAKDVKDLSEKIGLLLSDKKLRKKISENAYEYVKRKHNWDVIIEKYINVYEKHI